MPGTRRVARHVAQLVEPVEDGIGRLELADLVGQLRRRGDDAARELRDGNDAADGDVTPYREHARHTHDAELHRDASDACEASSARHRHVEVGLMPLVAANHPTQLVERMLLHMKRSYDFAPLGGVAYVPIIAFSILDNLLLLTGQALPEELWDQRRQSHARKGDQRDERVDQHEHDAAYGDLEDGLQNAQGACDAVVLEHVHVLAKDGQLLCAVTDATARRARYHPARRPLADVDHGVPDDERPQDVRGKAQGSKHQCVQARREGQVHHRRDVPSGYGGCGGVKQGAEQERYAHR